MKTKIFISILAISLVSGCIGMEIPGLPGLPGGGGVLGGGAGLEITSFTAEPSPVFSGATVRLIMETANQGGTSVENGDSLVYLTGSNFDAWGGDDFHHFEKTMKAEDVVRSIPADTKRFSWSLTAPTIIAGQTRSDTFIGRIYHEYMTTANGNVWVYSETEAEAARTAGRTLYKTSFTYTKGPVGLTLTVSPDPVILYGSEDEFTMYIKINNLATGTIYHPGSVTYTSGSEDIGLTSAELNNVTVAIDSTGVTFDSECEGDKELIAGKETTLVCTVTVSDSPDTFESFPMNVTVSYGYYTERTVSVTVQGR